MRFLAAIATCGLLAGVGGNAWAEQYRVEIDAPVAITTLLNKHLKMVQRKSRSGMTALEWQNLYQQAPAAIKDLLATEGYFSPAITSSLQQDDQGWLAQFKVETGAASHISAVSILFSGAITQQALPAPAPAQLRADWQLPVDRVFRQQDWDAAKRNLLQALLTERYPVAQIRHSRATVDPKARLVTLEVEIDSGPEFTFGAPVIEGLQNFPATLVENLNPTRPGQPFSQSELLRYQQRLQETRQFKSVAVYMNFDREQPQQTPIRIRLVEGAGKKLGFGLGYSTDTGYRGQITYDESNIFGRGWQWLNALKLEQYTQSLTSKIALPLDADGNRDSLAASWRHTDIQNEDTHTLNTSAMRRWGTQELEQSVSLNLFAERKEVSGVVSNTSGTTALGYGLIVRQLDNLLLPTRGFLLSANTAFSPGIVLSRVAFVQGNIKLRGYLPLTQSTQLLLRGEVGALSSSDPSVPFAYQFRTGGAQSVRGYDYESLGKEVGNATLGSRYVAVGSVEVLQWLTQQWGAAVFYDYGNAANRWSNLNPVAGYGLGARWKSPAGLLNFDLAYGQATGDYRVHFSLGLEF